MSTSQNFRTTCKYNLTCIFFSLRAKLKNTLQCETPCRLFFTFIWPLKVIKTLFTYFNHQIKSITSLNCNMTYNPICISEGWFCTMVGKWLIRHATRLFCIFLSPFCLTWIDFEMPRQKAAHTPLKRHCWQNFEQIGGCSCW